MDGILQPVVRAKCERAIQCCLFFPGTDEDSGIERESCVRELDDGVVRNIATQISLARFEADRYSYSKPLPLEESALCNVYAEQYRQRCQYRSGTHTTLAQRRSRTGRHCGNSGEHEAQLEGAADDE